MKITGNLPPELGLGATQSTGQGQEVRGPSALGATAGQQPQVELLTDAGIRILLGELTKMLDRQSSLVSELPPAVAATAEAALQQQSADNVLPQGLAALVKGARSGAETMATLAGRLEAAASLARAFPAGVPQALAELAAAVAARLSEQPEVQAATLQAAAEPAAVQAAISEATTSLPAAVSAEPGTGLPGQSVRSAAGAGGQPAPSPAGAATTPGADMKPPATTVLPAAEPMAGNAMAAVISGQTAKDAAMPGQVATGGQQGIALAAKADGLTVLTGELTRAAKGQADAAPAVGRLQQVLTEVVPDRPAPPVRAALNQATSALQAYLPAVSEKTVASRGQLSLQDGLVLLKVADSQPWLKLPETTLRQAADTLHELAAAVPGQQAADTAGNQSVLVMTVPLYIGPDGKAYPAYIHISQQREGGGRARDASAVRDTWLRVCLATENIGLVDIVFHVWGDRQLSVRAIFSEQATVEDFRRMVPAIREELASSPLTLTDISVVGAPVK